MKKRNTKGFTLAELLVVVAIIAILIAIAIPVFSAQTIKAKETADIANLRSAYAQATVDLLSENKAITKDNFYSEADTNALNYPEKYTFTVGENNVITIKYDAKKAAVWTQTIDPSGVIAEAAAS